MNDPLSLCNKTPTRQAILDFVAAVTTPGSLDFVPPAERIAVFDNDGTLWCEKPMYIQLDMEFRSLLETFEFRFRIVTPFPINLTYTVLRKEPCS